MLSTNQNAVFFYYRYLCMESINFRVFASRLVEVFAWSHQEKAASETYFGWVWSVVFLIQLDYMILWSSVSLGRIAYSLWFFVDGGSHQVRIACERSSFDWMWLVVPLIQSDCKILRLSISVERIKWYLFLYLLFFLFVFCCCCCCCFAWR